MSTDRFDIFFSGQVIEGQDEAAVQAKIGKMFKANPQQLERLFSGSPVTVKSGVDLDTAVKYRVAFRNAGALVDIKPQASETTPPAPPPPEPKTEEQGEKAAISLDLLPPNTGSLVDCALEIDPASIPDISGVDLASPGVTMDESEPPPLPPAKINVGDIPLNLASPGVIMDESEPPPPADISTGDLILNPANTGSLEDCQEDVQTAEIPDISALKVVDSE
ncbi:hypothetical protein MNBD_GAMMA26-65 [hydrothermal vent metagenome]|uniref:Uncharacterized protein n=1 Tax=hydrothermal vent metagenome TaxID=652676 RepID=A0A3B1BZ83_9ZZZZ